MTVHIHGEQPAPIRLLVADDSPTVRALIRAMVAHDPDISVVGEAVDGREAVSLSRLLRPNVVLMDIQMPGMDGREATEQIMASCPVPVIAFSSHIAGKDSKDSMDMLAAGAIDVMAKPDFTDETMMARGAHQLIHKIRCAFRAPMNRRPRGGARDPVPAVCPVAGLDAARPYAAVGIGASSGGPGALRELFSHLPPSFPLPVLIVQHITPGFSAGFVEWLQHCSPLKVRHSGPQDVAATGTVLVAPEGRQMVARKGGVVQALSDQPKGVHLPSIDVLFSSMADVYGSGAIGVILTGMGADGVEGLLEIRNAGGLTIAQDWETSVVFGMPGEAVRREAAQIVLSPRKLAEYLVRHVAAPSRVREGEGA